MGAGPTAFSDEDDRVSLRQCDLDTAGTIMVDEGVEKGRVEV